MVTTPTYHQDDPAADTAPVQRDWISRAGNVQHVAGAGLVDIWKITGPLDPLACAAAPGARAASACYQVGVAYPLDNALFQWEEGARRLRELEAEPRGADRGAAPWTRSATSSAAGSARPSPRRSWPTSTAAGTDWCLEAARAAAPMAAVDLDPQAIVDGAFFLYLRGRLRTTRAAG